VGILESMRREWCVYWEYSGQDRNGKDTYLDPIEIKVRWEDKAEQDFLPNGQEVMIKSTVYVDRLMPLGGVLWLGLLVDFDLSTPPEHNKIKVFRSIPKKNARKFLRIARL
jgi:hypothetical protein